MFYKTKERKSRLIKMASMSVGLALFASTAPTYAVQGPGLGNLSYSAGEVNTQVSTPLVDDSTGLLPPDYPGSKHYGVNVMTMLNGYMIGIFAPDSGGGPGGWIALDASNPRNLQLVKQVYEPDTTNIHRTGNGLRTAEFREPHSLGLAEGNLIAIQSGKGIEIWDWSDVQNPIQVSKLPISGVNFGDYNNVSWQLFWQAPYLYVSRGNAGLTIVNTSNIASPYVEKTVPRSALGGFNVGPVFALGNELYISSMEGTAGFSMVDISDPVNPVLTKSVSSIPQLYYASCWDGNLAYFASRSAGDQLRVYDTNQTPIALVHDQTNGFVNLYCNLQDQKLFLGNQDDINMLDVSDINSFVVEGTASLNATGTDVDHGQVFAFGNMVWVGNDHGSGSGLIAHSSSQDLTPPTLNRMVPEHLSTNQPLTSRIGLALSDSILMASVNSSTFKVTKLGTNTPLNGTYSVNLGFVHFAPTNALEADQIYIIELSGIQDFSGNTLASQQFRFSTGNASGHTINVNNVSPIQTGQMINVSATSQPILGGAISYSWDFGDGNVTAFSSQGSASHSYAAPGHYTAIVTARENGLDTTASIPITIYNPVNAITPTQTSTIADNGDTIFVVNEDNNTVSAIDAQSPFNKLWESPVAAQPRTLALAPDSSVWVVSEKDSAITVLSALGTTITTIDLPRGSQAYGIAFTPDQSIALVSLQGTGELVKFDTNTRQELGRVNVGQSARAIAITSNSATALVTRFVSPQSQAEVIEVNIATMTIAKTIALAKDTTTVDGPDRARGIPNYLSGITIAPDGQTAWVAANKANVDRGPFLEDDVTKRLTFETTIRAITAKIDINSGLELSNQQLDIDNRAQPKAIVFSELGDYVYVALEGQNSVEIRDAYSNNRASELAHTGLAPRGLVKVGTNLFVHNFMSRTVSVFDVSSFENGSGTGNSSQLASIETVANEVLHPRVLAGKQLFYNAEDARMTQDGYISCASCHTGAGSDHRVWDFTDRGEGLRNTIVLQGRTGTGLGNVHWTANFDEIHDFENDIRHGFGGRGFIDDALFASVENPLGDKKAGLSDDLDNLSIYLESLNEFPLSPFRNANGSLTNAAQAGAQLFIQKGCASCHSGDFFTDQQRHDVGTIQPSSGLGIGQSLSGVGFKTPILLGLFESAPYFHNGQAATLNDVLQTGQEHSVNDATERAQLVAYLEQIEYEGPPVIVPTPPAASQYFYLSDRTETSATNGWGPFEKDASNGENAANDGGTLSIGGSQYEKGLGVHANSDIRYDISDQPYDRFQAFIGVDDEVGDSGSVVFEVYVDGVLSFQSGTLTGSDVAQAVFVNLPAMASQLRLIVTGANDGVGSDHADWGDAKLRLPGEVVGGVNPGLHQGEIAGAMNTTQANPNTSITLDLAQTETSLPVNTTRVFSGYVFDADGNIAFMENIDDNTRLWIDGILVLNNDAWNQQTTTGNLALSPGWHSFELRIGNTSGPGGPSGPIGFGFDPNGGANWVHPTDNGSGNLFSTTLPEQFTYASDLAETSATNGWGPIEKDFSNGEAAVSDGVIQSINGVTFAKGIGVHADSSVIYSFTAGSFDQFRAFVGIDDEVGNNGSVAFDILLDGSLAFSSSELTGADGALEVVVPIGELVTQIELKAKSGAGNGYDHANWADAKFRHPSN
ncbi:NPCBM/NEW2 domain-containing protein [Reinekea sp.]|jgi:PKD repeat protein|uniref:NPCBM/NEW2 domain-containing protein n=1 Tax=Reinekea sp. TaxID=1970455 RepID=UPI0039891D61